MVNISGVVCASDRFEGMVWGEVEKDGDNATAQLVQLISNSKFHTQLHAVLLDGIAFGGFNIVDLQQLHEQLGLPCIAAMRREPDLVAIGQTLQHFDDCDRRMALIEKAGPIQKRNGFIFQHMGIDADNAAELLNRVTCTGKVPESLRIAHFIGAAIKTGESSNRA